DDGVHLLDAGDLPRLLHRVDDAAMAAARDDDEAAPLEVEAGRVLVPVLVRHDPALALGGGEMGGVAPGAVLLAVFDEGVGDDALDARALDPPGREGLVADEARRLGRAPLDAEPLQIGAVEHLGRAEFVALLRELPAEIVLAADDERE